MSDRSLEELFARLKAPPAATQDVGYQPPSVSSPIFSPPARATPPMLSSDVLSPAMGTPAPDQRSNHLLNLLKFNGDSPRPAASPAFNAAPQPHQHVANLVGSLQRAPSASAPSLPNVGVDQAQSSTPSASQKEYLLNLLNRPKESPVSIIRSSSPAAPILPASPSPSAGIEKLTKGFAETSIQAPQPQPTIFNHVNAFDQLHAISPLGRSPLPAMQAAPKKIEILKNGRDTSSAAQAEAPAPKGTTSSSAQLPAGPSPLPTDGPRQSVSEALDDIGEQVEKQVERALAAAGANGAGKPAQAQTAPTAAPAAATSAAAAPAVKSQPTAATTAGDDVESSWESAEDEEQQGDYEVPVYNFPMKPFVCIQLKPVESPVPIRQDDFMMIAQLKKSFDQVDRCLIAATQSHISYAQLATKKDNAGLRIIRQDNGDHKQVFRSSGERVFNVQFCTSSSDVETVLGTGVNGSVFWTSLAKSRGELFVDDDIEAQGIIIPAVATAEEQISGSPVKTRAKMSSSHPEYFAISRGKQIYIIAPETAKDKSYCDAKTRVVDSERLFIDHGLKIVTGKAGKDFCFSEDDTIIVSLDKSGRIKFWDIRELTKRAVAYNEGKQEAHVVSEPLWTFTAAASHSKPDEKPSVSSVTFIDKDKPTAKGSALRYLLIGFKQNHILQLYDLALKKAVQEIRLPHENDSDGFCSLSYHPRTGIIAIAHPTRNSIYLVHLSAPKYTSKAQSQAKFIESIALDQSPKPENTAIMSGARELSFAKVGQLRSLEMLRDPVEQDRGDDPEEETLFELYIMHSKGATGISIKRKDLGWNKTNNVLKPLDVIESGFAVVTPLDIPVAKTPSQTASASGSVAPSPSPAKKQEPIKTSPAKVEIKKEAVTPALNGAARDVAQTSAAPPAPLSRTASYAMAAQRAKSPAKENVSAELAAPKHDASANTSAALPATRPPSDDGIQTALAKQFGTLYQRIDNDRRVQEAAGAAQLDAVLRLVSSTLTENVEQSLRRIVSTSIETHVLPAVGDVTSKAIDKKLAETLPQQLSSVVSKEVKAVLPAAMQQALKDPSVHRAISDQVAGAVQQQVTAILQQSLPTMATQAAQKMISDLEARTAAQLRETEARRKQDTDKILELSNLVIGLSQTMSTMSSNQSAFQEQMLKLQRLSGADVAANDVSNAQVIEEPAEDQDARNITQKLMDGHYDEATLEWLQSTAARQGELFDQIFVRVNPQYLNHVSPLIALSVSAAITATFDTNVDKRLDWLGTVLSDINLQDADIRGMAPKIMDVLSQRLQVAYMQISEANPSDLTLKRIAALNRQVNEVKRLAG